MIEITIRLSEDGRNIKEIESTGHAGFGQYGQDIVCAAVSSQLISVENSIDQLLQIPVQSQLNEIDGGYLKLTFPTLQEKRPREDMQLLLRHLVLALEITAQAYPEYIRITQSK